MSMNYSKYFNPRATTQSDRIPGRSEMVQNYDGAYVFPVTDWTRLDRFLVLGAEGNSYYASEKERVIENAEAVGRCLAQDGLKTVARIVEISQAGRAPKNNPALFALALASVYGSELAQDQNAFAQKAREAKEAGRETPREVLAFEQRFAEAAAVRRAALNALPQVARYFTDFVTFVKYRRALGGWGRSMRRATRAWIEEKSVQDLTYQMTKFVSREGYTTRDVLRLVKPKVEDAQKNAVLHWATQGEIVEGAPAQLLAREAAFATQDKKELIRLIVDHRLTHEMIPNEWKNDPEVWAALLPEMPSMALVRNLAKMTQVGLLAPFSEASRMVAERLRNPQGLKRVHPFKLLVALLTYQAGRGIRGSNVWTPVPQVIDALDAAFYLSFANVIPTNRNLLAAIDVSGSMEHATLMEVPGLTPRYAAAAFALVLAATEPNVHFIGYTKSVVPLTISPRMRLDDVVRALGRVVPQMTDCSLPARWAQENRVRVDGIVHYTDSVTNMHHMIHPSLALVQYRQALGVGTKQVIAAMDPNGFSIADPQDARQMDVVGLDTATPQIISDFLREE